MNQLMTRSVQSGLMIAASLLSCTKIEEAPGDSVLTGATSTFLQRDFPTLKPPYELLPQSGTLKVSIFISADGEGLEVADMKKFGEAATRDIVAWLGGNAGKGGFVTNAKVTGPETANGLKSYKITSSAVKALGGSSAKGTSAWEVNIYAGSMLGFRQLIGKAMLDSHITIVNFSLGDVPDGVLEQGKDGYQSYFTPMLNTFRAQVASHNLPYRLWVTNGCLSEDMEDVFLGVAKETKQRVELIGHRGLNNRRYFATQMSRLFRGLALGQTWAEIVKGFDVNEGGEGAADLIMPVFRSQDVVGDKSEDILPPGAQ